MTHYVVRRRTDWCFLARHQRWVEDLSNARLFTQKGHAKQAEGVYAYISYRDEDGNPRSRKERARLRKERFDAEYEVVPVTMVLS